MHPQIPDCGLLDIGSSGDIVCSLLPVDPVAHYRIRDQ